MAKKNTAMNTGRIPLEFAKKVSAVAESAFRDGSMAEAVSPVTRELLKFWFAEPFTNRPLNFHEGQKKAILNAIYLHEVVGAANMAEAWQKIAPELLGAENGAAMAELAKDKYAYPKYCVKMATGTGKTWVMHALLIWQYLNARFESHKETRKREGGKPNFTKNFLFVAPGLIVYERLLDAFCGKRIDGSEARDFATSDIQSCESLFVPPQYREAMYGFLQNSLVRKEDFGRKVTGDGTLAVMNWHAFLSEEEAMSSASQSKKSPPASDDAKDILDDLLPAKPGTTGNELESLDAAFLRGGRLDFLKELPDLMLVNDEAHHVHGGTDDEEEVKWQQGIDALAKGKRFIQLDFSATPYEPSGSGRNKREDYFPHVMVDYDLPTAIRAGLVKTIVIDQRKDLTGELGSLDYNAIRDGRDVVGLSEGQRLMLRAGLAKLRYLEKEFSPLDAEKRPKMMVVCEDTGVTPFVSEFLRDEGLSEDDILTVDSNRQGEVGEKEWSAMKGKLFAVDKRDKPRVIVSVLMLREGFDVNNICVIVPLRASKAQILLEQTLGRGLRLMWREPEYRETKGKARRQLLEEKVEPCAVLDFLYIIEHPAFVEFYDSLVAEGLVGSQEAEDKEGGGTDDLVHSVLKEDYEK
ncbi:MAG: DEAD/DEAH box helicase family protein, partial [Kiritimatiellae bacterium]|nr:DEAD/DEAH box helicase family protein [Kiritimatiellia bacterium]